MTRVARMNAHMRIHLASPYDSSARASSGKRGRASGSAQAGKSAPFGRLVQDKVRPLFGRIAGMVRSSLEGRDVRAARQVRTERRHIDRALRDLLDNSGQSGRENVTMCFDGNTARRIERHAQSCANLLGSGLTAGDVTAARLKATVRAMSTEQRVALGRGLMTSLSPGFDVSYLNVSAPGVQPHDPSPAKIDLRKLWLNQLFETQADALRAAMPKMTPIARWEMLGTLSDWSTYVGGNSRNVLAQLLLRPEFAADSNVSASPTSMLHGLANSANSVVRGLKANASSAVPSVIATHAESAVTSQIAGIRHDARAAFERARETFLTAVSSSAASFSMTPDTVAMIDDLGDAARRCIALNGGTIASHCEGVSKAQAPQSAHAVFNMIRQMYANVENAKAVVAVFDALVLPSTASFPDLTSVVQGIDTDTLYAMGERWGGRPMVTPHFSVQLHPTRQEVRPTEVAAEFLLDIKNQVDKDALTPTVKGGPGLNPVFVRDALGPTTMRMAMGRMVITAADDMSTTSKPGEIRLNDQGLADCSRELVTLCDGDVAWARRVSGYASQTGARMFSMMNTPWQGGAKAMPTGGEVTTTYEIHRTSDQDIVVSILNVRRNHEQMMILGADGHGEMVPTEGPNTYRVERCAYQIRRSGEVTLVEPVSVVSDIQRSATDLCEAIAGVTSDISTPKFGAVTGNGLRVWQRAQNAVDTPAAFLSPPAIMSMRNALGGVVSELMGHIGNAEGRRTLAASLQDDEIGAWASRARDVARAIGAQTTGIDEVETALKDQREMDIQAHFVATIGAAVDHVSKSTAASTGRNFLDLCASFRDAQIQMQRRYAGLGRKAPPPNELVSHLKSEIPELVVQKLKAIAESADGLGALRALALYGLKTAGASETAAPKWLDSVQAALLSWIEIAPRLGLWDGDDGGGAVLDPVAVRNLMAADARTALGLHFDIAIQDGAVVEIGKSIHVEQAKVNPLLDFKKVSDQQWRDVTHGVARNDWPLIPHDGAKDVHRRNIWIGDDPRCNHTADQLAQDLLALTEGNRAQTWMVGRCVGQEVSALVRDLMASDPDQWPIKDDVSGEKCMPTGSVSNTDQLANVHVRREPNGDIRVDMVERIQNHTVLMVNDPLPLAPSESWSVLTVSLVVGAKGDVRMAANPTFSTQWKAAPEDDSVPVVSPPPFLYRPGSGNAPMSPLNLGGVAV